MELSEIMGLKRGDVVLLDNSILVIVYLVIIPGTPAAKEFEIEDTIHPDEYWIEYFMQGSFVLEPISIRDFQYLGSVGRNILITNQKLFGNEDFQ